MDALHDVGDIGLDIDVVDFTRLDDGQDDRRQFGALEASREESVPAPDRKSAHTAFGNQVVGLELTIVEEAVEGPPSPGRIGERLGDLRVAAEGMASVADRSFVIADIYEASAAISLPVTVMPALLRLIVIAARPQKDDPAYG